MSFKTVAAIVLVAVSPLLAAEPATAPTTMPTTTPSSERPVQGTILHIDKQAITVQPIMRLPGPGREAAAERTFTLDGQTSIFVGRDPTPDRQTVQGRTMFRVTSGPGTVDDLQVGDGVAVFSAGNRAVRILKMPVLSPPSGMRRNIRANPLAAPAIRPSVSQ